MKARFVLTASALAFALCGCSREDVSVRMDRVFDPMPAAGSNRVCFSVSNSGNVPVFVEEPGGAECCDTLIGTNWIPCEIDGNDLRHLFGFRLDPGESRLFDIERPEAVDWQRAQTGTVPVWRFRIRFWRSRNKGQMDFHLDYDEDVERVFAEVRD